MSSTPNLAEQIENAAILTDVPELRKLTSSGKGRLIFDDLFRIPMFDDPFRDGFNKELHLEVILNRAGDGWRQTLKALVEVGLPVPDWASGHLDSVQDVENQIIIDLHMRIARSKGPVARSFVTLNVIMGRLEDRLRKGEGI